MYSWILSCCVTGVAIIDISCTISVTVKFIMLCNTVQATFNVTPSIVHAVDIIMWLLHVLSVSK